jgi:hypothetical protein
MSLVGKHGGSSRAASRAKPSDVLRRTPGKPYVSTHHRGPAPLNTAIEFMTVAPQPPPRSGVREFWSTAGHGLAYFFGLTSLFWIFGVIALDRAIKLGPMEVFRIGSVPIPKWEGAGFTNLDVLIFCGVAIVALAVALVVRYLHHRGKLRALRSRGITDFNQDGRRDVFTDRFLDDL